MLVNETTRMFLTSEFLVSFENIVHRYDAHAFVLQTTQMIARRFVAPDFLMKDNRTSPAARSGDFRASGTEERDRIRSDGRSHMQRTGIIRNHDIRAFKKRKKFFQTCFARPNNRIDAGITGDPPDQLLVARCTGDQNLHAGFLNQTRDEPAEVS